MKRPKRKTIWLVLGGFGLCVFASAGIAAFLIYSHYHFEANKFDLAELHKIPQRSSIYGANGEVWCRIHGENRILISLEEVPKEVIQAVLAREDTRFYDHHGVDYRGILRALVRNVKSGDIQQGGSTITQQLARNTYQLKEKTLQRKLLEAMLARRIEENFSKEEILELYMNRIFLGRNLYGLEAAARTYFGSTSSKLTLSQSALIVGIIRSPNTYDPYERLDSALRQRDQVLDRMVYLGMINADQASAAKKPDSIEIKKRPPIFHGNYALDAVVRELGQILTEDQIGMGGLKVYTTIDPELQNYATQALESHLKEVESQKRWKHSARTKTSKASSDNHTDYLQASLIAIDNKTGAVRAIVGGRDYEESKFNRALHGARQAGSAFKPFVYAAAFKKGLQPGTLIDDAEIYPGEIRGAPADWSPVNSDNESLGYQPAEIMSLRVGIIAGLNHVTQTAELVGLRKPPPYPSIILGSFETTVKDLTTAYTVFPNNGILRESYFIERVETLDGQLIYNASHKERLAIPADVAWLTSEILQQVMTRGTAARSRSLGFHKPAGGKTGTTNSYKDAWFIGYTTGLTCGVWVGMDQPKTIMNRGYGSTLALPIWVKFMSKASRGEYAAREFRSGVSVRHARLCSITGDLASEGCEFAQASYDAQMPESIIPSDSCKMEHIQVAQLVNENELPITDSEIIDQVQNYEPRTNTLGPSSNSITPVIADVVATYSNAPQERSSAWDEASAEINQPAQSARLCSITGARATSGCDWAGTTYTANIGVDRIPGVSCHLHEEIPVARPVEADFWKKQAATARR
jgi:penicillin-binding protein 1A